VTLADEYQLIEKDFKKCNLEAIDHSFASNDLKQKVRKKIEAAY